MGNNQIKKHASIEHNRLRVEAHVESVRIAQDKIDNPEKYAMTKKERAARTKAQSFVAMAMGLSVNGFNSRHLK